jgi:hypothetical protein
MSATIHPFSQLLWTILSVKEISQNFAKLPYRANLILSFELWIYWLLVDTQSFQDAPGKLNPPETQMTDLRQPDTPLLGYSLGSSIN